MAVVPTVSAHDCDSAWAEEYCGDCPEGTHDDTSRYNSDGDTSCSSEDKITQCDIYWLIRDIVTAGNIQAAQN
jgi:hypothetical protein